MDTQTQNIYFAAKDNTYPFAQIYSFNVTNWPSEMLLAQLSDIDRTAEVKLVFAKKNETKYLIAIGAFSHMLDRFEITGNTLGTKNYAYLPDSLKDISSVLYYEPHIYISTYEPSSLLGRIHIDSFCPAWCSDNGYCLLGKCTCMPGYNYDPVQICTASTQPSIIYVREEIGLSVGIGILCFTNLLFIILWYRARRNTYTALSS